MLNLAETVIKQQQQMKLNKLVNLN